MPVVIFTQVNTAVFDTPPPPSPFTYMETNLARASGQSESTVLGVVVKVVVPALRTNTKYERT